MTLNAVLQKDARQRQLVEGARIALFVVILFVSLASDLFQPAFINWSMLLPFYSLITVGMIIHLGLLSALDRVFSKPMLLFASFIVDAALISGLIFYSGLNQSLFLFLHLINILIAGIVFRSEGALIVALLTSVFFTAAALLGPEIKAVQFVLLLVLNNIAFFLVAGLSGYLADQLQTVGTELRKTGLSLKAAKELNQLVIENIPSGLLTFDAQGNIFQYNEASRRILGLEILEGKNVYDLMQGFEPREAREESRFDLKYASPDGNSKILGVLASGFESPELGGHVRVALIEDLTKVRFLEGNLRQAEKMAAVGGLAAGIAHEIRNPLSGISGSIELLSRTATDEDDKKLMNIVMREIDRLNSLITEFLEYARPETPPVDPVDLVPLVQEVMNMAALSKGVRKETEVIREFAPKAVIAGKSEKLKQAFLNILINAHQAMENTLRPVLEVRISEEENQTVVHIRDNGCGMKESTLKRIFEPFHTTKTKGTGLGLAITHKILEGHGARIFVESEEGRGTDFKLVFPRFELRS